MMIRHPALTMVHPRPRPLVLSGFRVWEDRLRLRHHMRRRRRLASGYEHAVAAAERPGSAFTARVPLRRRAVRAVRPDLLAVAALLRAEGPLPPAGVAAARRLIVDGNGPLYVEGDLGAAVLRVLVLLEGGRRS